MFRFLLRSLRIIIRFKNKHESAAMWKPVRVCDCFFLWMLHSKMKTFCMKIHSDVSCSWWHFLCFFSAVDVKIFRHRLSVAWMVSCWCKQLTLDLKIVLHRLCVVSQKSSADLLSDELPVFLLKLSVNSSKQNDRKQSFARLLLSSGFPWIPF